MNAHSSFSSLGHSHYTESGHLSGQWAATQDAAAAVAMLAGLAPEKPDSRITNFPLLIEEMDERRIGLASNLIADMAAMMRPGLTALLAASAQGQNAAAPALILWQEYYTARRALLELLPEPDEITPYSGSSPSVSA